MEEICDKITLKNEYNFSNFGIWLQRSWILMCGNLENRKYNGLEETLEKFVCRAEIGQIPAYTPKLSHEIIYFDSDTYILIL